MVKHVKEIINLTLRILDQFIVFYVYYLKIILIFQKQDFQIGNTIKKISHHENSFEHKLYCYIMKELAVNLGKIDSKLTHDAVCRCRMEVMS